MKNFLKNLFSKIHYNNKFDFFVYKKLLSYKPKTLFPQLPKIVTIDPCTICNLTCPACVACKETPGFIKRMLSFEEFKKILNKMPFIKTLLLFNWGEPFLNPDFFQMVKYAKSKKLHTVAYSNFSLIKDFDFFINLVKCGLDDLLLSIDGVTQKNYEKFRRGGNLDLVFSNIAELNKAKKLLKSNKPKLFWHFTITRFNEDEIKKAKKKAKEFDMQFIPNYIIVYNKVTSLDPKKLEQKEKYWLPSKNRNFYHWQKNRPFRLNYPCQNLFTVAYFDSAGNAFPCRFLSDKRDSFGNILNNSFNEIWYNKKYLSARSLFIKNSNFKDKVPTICDYCMFYKKKNN